MLGGMAIMFCIAIYRFFREDPWINGVTVGYAGYIIGIMAFSFYQVAIISRYRNKINRFETICHSTNALNGVREELINESNNKNVTKCKTYPEMNYAVMRDLFIHPSYFPKYKENYLPHDFNFATYLGLCADKTLGKLLSMKVTTFLVLLVFISLWPLLLTLSIKTQVNI